MISTGVLLRAAGRARVKIEASRQSRSVEFEGLANGPAYKIMVDGIGLGTIESRSGFARVEFVSDASIQTLPVRGEFRPGV